MGYKLGKILFGYQLALFDEIVQVRWEHTVERKYAFFFLTKFQVSFDSHTKFCSIRKHRSVAFESNKICFYWIKKKKTTTKKKQKTRTGMHRFEIMTVQTLGSNVFPRRFHILFFTFFSSIIRGAFQKLSIRFYHLMTFTMASV